MDAPCKIQGSIHELSRFKINVSSLLGTYQSAVPFYITNSTKHVLM